MKSLLVSTMFALVLVVSANSFADVALSVDEQAAADGAEQKIVEFKIVKDTGMKPWNTRETAVQLKVGDTLRIFNEDSIDHFLHTPGRPCGHGTKSFGPGKFYDCVVSKKTNVDQDVLYDHQFGPKSRFYVSAE